MVSEASLLRDVFDSDWYLWRYPDIRTAGIDAWHHFWAHGLWEGRDPGSWFDSDWYLYRYPDVGNAGEVAFLHFLVSGVDQGRAPNRGWERDGVWPDGVKPSIELLVQILAGGESLDKWRMRPMGLGTEPAISLDDFAWFVQVDRLLISQRRS